MMAVFRRSPQNSVTRRPLSSVQVVQQRSSIIQRICKVTSLAISDTENEGVTAAWSKCISIIPKFMGSKRHVFLGPR
eukprot:Skav220609  [mRNA]  locus=scaffold507:225899:229163:- [translate_table: standard]